MRNKYTLTAFLLLALCIPLLTGCAPKRTFVGTWNGSVSFKNPITSQSISLPLVFHVTQKPDGTYASTMDITTFKMTAIPAQSFTVDGDKVTVAIQVATQAINFTGTSNAAGTEITGSLGQGKDTSPLKLTKAPDAK